MNTETIQRRPRIPGPRPEDTHILDETINWKMPPVEPEQESIQDDSLGFLDSEPEYDIICTAVVWPRERVEMFDLSDGSPCGRYDTVEQALVKARMMRLKRYGLRVVKRGKR